MNMKNFGDFSIFLQAFINELCLMKKKKEGKKEKDKMEIFVAEFLDYTKG